LFDRAACQPYVAQERGITWLERVCKLFRVIFWDAP
jgi:hypothetical protein